MNRIHLFAAALVAIVILLGVAALSWWSPVTSAGTTAGQNAESRQSGDAADASATSAPPPPADPDQSQGYRSRTTPLGDPPSDGANASPTLFTSHRVDPIELDFEKGPFRDYADDRVLKTDTATMVEALNQPDRPPQADLHLLGTIVDHFRRIFGANPIAGENRDLVMALTGRNPHGLALIDPAHPAINSEGELVDRWGTPFRFHPISSREPLEISSAGPDRRFGTPDDVRVEDPTRPVHPSGAVDPG